MSRDTVCASMYSLMSKRMNSMPSTEASCLATSVLPTPVGPANRKEPTGFSGWPRPARDSLIADASAWIASSCPKTESFRSRSSVSSRSRSEIDTLRGGILAIVATTCSMSLVRTIFLRWPAGCICTMAPASSMTSMALSGRWRSLMYFADSSAAARKRAAGVGHAVVLLVVRLQPLEDLVRLLGAGLRDLDLLEAPRQRPIAFEVALVVVERRRADAAQLARGQHRLEDVRRVHRAAAGRAGADDGVDLVDEEDGPRLLAQRRDHGLQPLLEVAAKARAGQQRAHVEGVDPGVLQRRWNLPQMDLQRQPFGERRLADAGFADEDGIVLAAAAEHAGRARQLLLAADERIDLAFGGAPDQVGGEERQRIPARPSSSLPLPRPRSRSRRLALAGRTPLRSSRRRARCS